MAGTVKFDDGTPVTGARLVLRKEENGQVHNASGDIADDGSFRISSEKPGDGALVGHYKIAVLEFKDHSLKAKPKPPLIQRKYTNFETSGLAVQVEQKNNYFDLVLSRMGK